MEAVSIPYTLCEIEVKLIIAVAVITGSYGAYYINNGPILLALQMLCNTSKSWIM